MPDTIKSLSDLLALFADNTSGDISEQDLRDFTISAILRDLTSGADQNILKPHTGDSTTFFQVLDFDGGTPILNIDSTNERVGIGTNSPDYTTELYGNGLNLAMSASGVNHGLTGISGMQSDTFYRVKPISDSNGGIVLYGISDEASTAGMQLTGIIGITNPTDATPAIILDGSKKNTTDTQALGNDETVLQVRNRGTAQVTVLGSGNVGIGTVSPDEKLHIALNGADDNNGEFAQLVISGTTDETTRLNIGYDTTNDHAFMQAVDKSTAFKPLEIGASEHDIKIGTDTKVKIDTAGNVGIGVTASFRSQLDISGDSICIRTSQSPASGGAGNQGEIAWDASYIYVCTATNTWERAALTGGY
jgi:hypothetical protein